MNLLTYILISFVIIGLCLLGMSIGLIFRNKTFRSCGAAARDFDGETIECAACGGKVNGTECKRKSKDKS